MVVFVLFSLLVSVLVRCKTSEASLTAIALLTVVVLVLLGLLVAVIVC